MNCIDISKESFNQTLIVWIHRFLGLSNELHGNIKRELQPNADCLDTSLIRFEQ
jgi:hypothetical protein